MFNPWALLFHIVCLFAVLRFFIEFPSWSLKSFQYLLPLLRSRSSFSKARFPNMSSALFLLVRVVFLDGSPSSCVHPVLNSLFLSSCHAHFFYGINGSERSWVLLFARAILKVNILTFLRNLFSRILHTIFSEPIYGLSFFSCFIHFACCSSSSYSLLRFLHQNVLAKRLNGGVWIYVFVLFWVLHAFCFLVKSCESD